MASAKQVLAELLEQLDGIGIPDWNGAEGLDLTAARAAVASDDDTDDLMNAARDVVDRWAAGDLAEAVRELGAILERINEPTPSEGQRASREATARMGIIPGMNDDDDEDTAGTVSVEVSHPYLISDNVGRMFWSNVDGWVERGSATRFTREERQTMRLPLGGYWTGDDE